MLIFYGENVYSIIYKHLIPEYNKNKSFAFFFQLDYSNYVDYTD